MSRTPRWFFTSRVQSLIAIFIFRFYGDAGLTVYKPLRSRGYLTTRLQVNGWPAVAMAAGPSSPLRETHNDLRRAPRRFMRLPSKHSDKTIKYPMPHWKAQYFELTSDNARNRLDSPSETFLQIKLYNLHGLCEASAARGGMNRSPSSSTGSTLFFSKHGMPLSWRLLTSTQKVTIFGKTHAVYVLVHRSWATFVDSVDDPLLLTWSSWETGTLGFRRFVLLCARQ